MGRGGFVSALGLSAALAVPATVTCAGNTSDVAEGGRSGNVGSGGKSSGTDGGQWPDGGPKQTGGSGGTTGGAGGSTGGAGAVGGSGGAATGGAGSGGAGGTSGSGGRGNGGAGGSPAEICNNQDDDGDGQVDENLTQSCTSACGTGTAICNTGVWGPCSSGLPKSCMNYATCQTSNQCVASCPSAPSESCNLDDDDCDGSCDESAGCRVSVHRSFSAASGEHFYTTSASEAACCGFTVEYQNYFYLYTSAAAGLVPFYRCALGIGYHFYTTSSNCEGAAGINEGVLGYIATSATCGSTVLYRLAHPNGDHFYTTSAAERDSAVSQGYINESAAGHVWAGP